MRSEKGQAGRAPGSCPPLLPPPATFASISHGVSSDTGQRKPAPRGPVSAPHPTAQAPDPREPAAEARARPGPFVPPEPRVPCSPVLQVSGAAARRPLDHRRPMRSAAALSFLFSITTDTQHHFVRVSGARNLWGDPPTGSGPHLVQVATAVSSAGSPAALRTPGDFRNCRFVLLSPSICAPTLTSFPPVNTQFVLHVQESVSVLSVRLFRSSDSTCR